MDDEERRRRAEGGAGRGSNSHGGMLYGMGSWASVVTSTGAHYIYPGGEGSKATPAVLIFFYILIPGTQSSTWDA